jgi:HEAT repeat protein
MIRLFAGLAIVAAIVLCLPIVADAQVPGPESFAQDPKSPGDLWNAIDYLTRSGQSKKAVPYLERFLKGPADDESLIGIRDKFGVGSILRLGDYPETARYAGPLAQKLAAAERRHATSPDRIARAVAGLTGSPGEQDYAVARLKEAGPFAVPALVEALDRPGITPEQRSLLVRNLGRLESTAVPPLLAVLDSGNPRLMADVAMVLGQIGDPRAVPFLTYPASVVEFAPEVREAAQAAIGRLTGRPFGTLRTPAQVLTDAAWQFHRHQVEFPGDPVAVWVWDKESKSPTPKSMRRLEAERYFGLRLAREAVRLQPQDLDAQAALVSQSLEQAIERVGYRALPVQDQATLTRAVQAGPSVLTEVLRKALADDKDELAAAAATALGQVTDRTLLSRDGRAHPLVDALWAPAPRVQFAAAKALANMAPAQPFPGSSRLVPTLARFLTTTRQPRAVVIDTNPNRGSQIVGSLEALGYEAVLETSGDHGFRAAAETADVELVLISYALHRGDSWGLTDTLTNLKSDARTAYLPVYVYGPLDLDIKRPNLSANFPGVRFLVQPVNPAILEKLLGGRPSKLSDSERSEYAQEAASLLSRIASQRGSPFAEDLSAAEPALVVALGQPGTSLAASSALGDVPNPDAQRSLADVVVDPSRPADIRRTSANQLARSIKRFGPLVSADQEERLVSELGTESDPRFHTVLETVVTALRAQAGTTSKHPLGVRTDGH